MALLVKLSVYNLQLYMCTFLVNPFMSRKYGFILICLLHYSTGTSWQEVLNGCLSNVQSSNGFRNISFVTTRFNNALHSSQTRTKTSISRTRGDKVMYSLVRSYFTLYTKNSVGIIKHPSYLNCRIEKR